MHTLEIRKPVEKMFFKLSNKNPKQFELISKKIEEIQLDPYHYKNLKKPLNHLRRVHMDNKICFTFFHKGI